MSLFSVHPRSLTTLFSDIETYAAGQPEAFVGTGGAVLERTNATQFEFYAHQFYDALGKKRERYVAGPTGSSEADALADRLRARIEELKQITASIRLLGREGFQLADSRTYATVAALRNRDLFTAGGVLVGSHAYGVLLNMAFFSTGSEFARRRIRLRMWMSRAESGLPLALLPLRISST
jgi:hypothetical protein